ncbi:DUF3899 domain-containing protein [Lentibacillus amyloliquefaciens]|uniref:DUF3899 domain-containing protein n=1 Tax=Lentibacillus amyloliquefaciens TaxID=1472767 RepID=A0A0U4DWN1_9BACI|nr:DUF3899 domain-containing protein [Lentibacillus amyloliquefaciens]ALX49784.1 hypothetical protein AOX59_15120 [Lentibacillus amyloliquefaciens]
MLKTNIRIFLINCGTILLIVYLLESALTLRQLLDITFYFVLVYMVFALFLYTVKGGFYDGVTFGFRRFLSIMSKGGDPLEEWRDKPPISTQISTNLYRVVRFQWLSLTVLLTILFILYYAIN